MWKTNNRHVNKGFNGEDKQWKHVFSLIKNNGLNGEDIKLENCFFR